MRQSCKSLILYSSCRHVCSCLFSEMVSELRPEWLATRPWLAFQAKAMVKKYGGNLCANLVPIHVFDHFWLLLTNFDRFNCFWPTWPIFTFFFKTFFDRIWQLLPIFDCFWPILTVLTVFDCCWPFLTVFDRFYHSGPFLTNFLWQFSTFSHRIYRFLKTLLTVFDRIWSF